MAFLKTTDDQSLLIANGLANVQKRLSLLYPGNHELKMTMEQEMYHCVFKYPAYRYPEID